MALSLRGIVHTHYDGIPSNFSVINDVLSRAKYDVGEQTYRTADGRVSLRLLLLALEQTRPPLDLVWIAVDDNGLPLNPKWRYQVITGAVPDPEQVSHNSNFPNTSQMLNIDLPQGDVGVPFTHANICFIGGSTTFGINGHFNWLPGATYEGPIYWEGKSTEGTDDDYQINLKPPDGAGLTAHSNGVTTYDGRTGYIELEFDSDETADHFHTPWWQAFHDVVNNGDDSSARLAIDERFAIATGLFGIDCAHNASAELHPVWALAIRLNEFPPDQVWAIFVRNWGNEGYCSSSQHNLYVQVFKIRLPWLQGASSVSYLDSTQFLRNDSRAQWVGFEYTPNEGVLLTFTLPPPEAQGRINGELHLQWG